MNNKPASELDALSILGAIPGCHLILLPDAPRFTIAGATDDYLSAAGLEREAAIGHGLFETGAVNPAAGVKDLSDSLAYVLERKVAQRMADQRYEVSNPATGTAQYRVWSPVNKPVLDGNGDVQYIIHTLEDSTGNSHLQDEERRAGRQKPRNLFHNIVEHVPVAILLSTGDDVVIETVNAPMLQLMNRTSAGEVTGRKLLEVLPELKDQPSYEAVLNVQRTGIPCSGVDQAVDLLVNGVVEHRYFNFSYTPVMERNEIRGVLHVAVDVTLQVEARKQMERAKSDTEKQKRLYETINNSTPDLIYVFDTQYRFTYANRALLDMWGNTWENSIGKGLRENGYEEWHAVMHEREIDHVIGTKTSIRGEVAFPHAQLGKRIYDYIFVPVINEKGEVEAVAGTTRDITELKKAEEVLKESEQHLRTLIMQAPVAMCFMVGPDHIVDIANEHILKLWGKPREAMMNKPIFEGLPDAREQGLEKILAQVYRTGETFRATEHPVELLRNGKTEIVYQNFVYEPYRDTQGNIMGIIAITTDVTDQVAARRRIEETVALRTKELAQANESLQNINRELHRSNQNLEEFAHAASHDLKEPIRKIHFFTHQLKEQLSARLTEAESRSFGRIENASQRMGNLIDDLLLYSHVSQRPHETDDIDLNESLKRVLEDLEVDIQEKGAVIHAGRLPVVQGYRRQLQQLFQNLLSNALKYSKEGVRPEIEITAEQRAVRGRLYHLVSVRDNGIGFEQEYSARIFQMFTRLHGRSEYSGTGVGLSIVKKVVENHDGFIEVESVPGEGSVFTVLLPVE